MVFNCTQELMSTTRIKTKPNSRFHSKVNHFTIFGKGKPFMLHTTPLLLQRKKHDGIQFGQTWIILDISNRLQSHVKVLFAQDQMDINLIHSTVCKTLNRVITKVLIRVPRDCNGSSILSK